MHGALAEKGAVEGDDRGVHRLVERLELKENLPPLRLVRLDRDHLERQHRVGRHVQHLLYDSRRAVADVVQHLEVRILDLRRAAELLEGFEARRRRRTREARRARVGEGACSGQARRLQWQLECRRRCGRRDGDGLGLEAERHDDGARGVGTIASGRVVVARRCTTSRGRNVGGRRDSSATEDGRCGSANGSLRIAFSVESSHRDMRRVLNQSI